MTPKRVLGVVTAVAVVSAGAGWLAGRELASPEDARFDARAPEPSLISVPVEARTLAANVVFRGTVRFSDTSSITLAASGTTTPVVTGGLPEAGTEVAEGALLAEVSGRPVFLLEGRLPAYRSLAPGSEGDDVVQLEEALARLGFNPGPVDGVYDTATEGAVSAWYAASGYEANEPSEDQAAQLDSARDSVDSAREAVSSAAEALEQAGEPLSASERLQLDTAVAQAQRSFESATAERTRQDASTAQAVTDATAARDRAQTAATAAATRLTQAEGGVHPDTGVAPTLEELATLRQAKADADTALAAARSAVTEATTNRDRTVAEQRNAVTSAYESWVQAAASRDERLEAPDVASQQRALADARENLGDAQADLADLDAELGVSLPKTELVFLPELPRRVNAVNVDVGDPLGSSPALEVSGAELVVDAAVSTADRPLVEVGQEVRLDEEGLGVDVAGTVVEVADEPGTNDVGEGRYYVKIEPDVEAALEAGLDLQQIQGVNLRVTVPIESTGGDVLAVPLAALSAAADGTARVQVIRPSGAVEFVSVTVGLTAQGYVQITPVDTDLEVGDQVVVGLEGVADTEGADVPDNPTGSGASTETTASAAG